MVKFFKSFRYAMKGILSAFKSERNMKIHSFITLLVVVFGFLFRISTVEWMVVLIVIGLVFCAEMFNTALEALVDKVSPERDANAGKVKDISAGAVLICAIIAALVGLIVFLPKIIALF